MKLRLVLAFAAVALSGLAATAHAQDRALVERGAQVYAELKCTMKAGVPTADVDARVVHMVSVKRK